MFLLFKFNRFFQVLSLYYAFQIIQNPNETDGAGRVRQIREYDYISMGN